MDHEDALNLLRWARNCKQEGATRPVCGDLTLGQLYERRKVSMEGGGKYNIWGVIVRSYVASKSLSPGF